jgi:hypothetical protein
MGRREISFTKKGMREEKVNKGEKLASSVVSNSYPSPHFIGGEHPVSAPKITLHTPGKPLRTNGKPPRGRLRWGGSAKPTVRSTPCGPQSPSPSPSDWHVGPWVHPRCTRLFESVWTLGGPLDIFKVLNSGQWQIAASFFPRLRSYSGGYSGLLQIAIYYQTMTNTSNRWKNTVISKYHKHKYVSRGVGTLLKLIVQQDSYNSNI